jgi:hypothetical protein
VTIAAALNTSRLMITPSVLSWQWAVYRAAHADRRNLLIHLVTVPIFWSGLVQLLCAPFLPLLIISGISCLFLAFLCQAIGHRLEVNPPHPFLSPVDVVVRFFLEQTINFPRYLLSGGFRAAWGD